MARSIIAIPALHAPPRAGLASRPCSARLIGCVDSIATGVFQPQGFAAVAQTAGIGLVSCDVGDRGVVSPFQEEKNRRRQFGQKAKC
jgi:hypothetical protein